MDRLRSLPGFIGGATKWNLLVGTGYVLVGALFLLFLPLVAAVALGGDYRGLATRLSKLPGITAGGGAMSGVTGFVLVGSVWGAAALPAPAEEVDGPTSDISTPQTPSDSPNATSGTSTPTVSSVSSAPNTSSQSDTATASPLQSPQSDSRGDAKNSDN